MPVKQFTDNVLPILGNNNRALMAISTPGDDANWYSQIVNFMVEGDSPLRIIAKQLACLSCRAVGREAQCEHNKYILPAYKDAAITRLQKQILPENVYMAEVQGVVTATGAKVFDPQTVTRLRDRRPFVFKDTKVIWVSVDPSGGSPNGSRAAVYAFAINSKSQFVVRLPFANRQLIEELADGKALDLIFVMKRHIRSSAHTSEENR